MKSVGVSLVFGSILGLLAAGCPVTADGVCYSGTCDPPLAGIDGGGDGPAKPDPCIDTPTAPECITDEAALFVSPSGDDGAAGTKAAPLKTVKAALAKVTGERKRVYVCTGSYAEQVEITVSVSILGGLACDFTNKAAPPKLTSVGAPAIRVTKAAPVALVDVDVEATADTQTPGASAVGVFVSESDGVTLRRVNIKAGPGTNGTNGADGDATPNYSEMFAPGGNSTVTTTGAVAPDCGKCADGATFSTAGNGANTGGLPSAGSASPPVGTPNGGGTVGPNCVPATDGANGLAGAAATGATRPGTLTRTGWDPKSDATNGPLGNPGQGGGGGGSDPGAGGGSGGCGGCGGTGGKAGTNGGSSFALLVFQSAVTIEDGAFETADGGKAGDGGIGQVGQRRGTNGGGACDGGKGGYGAGGGGGGGAAGGHSVAIGYVGTKPDVKRTAFKMKAGGGAGAGGDPGTSLGNAGNKGGAGADGTSAETLAL